MENKSQFNEHEPIPYFAFEGIQARAERRDRRHIIVIIILIVLLFAESVFTLYEWTRYDYTSEDSSVTVDAQDGIANYIGERGNINYGTDYGTQDYEK